MSKLLIELPHTASTDKYDKYFPIPLHLLKMKSDGDELIDLNLLCYNKKNEEKYKIIDNLLERINTKQLNVENVIVCAGSYIPDADKRVFYEYFLDKINVPITLTGPYADIFKKDILVKYRFKEFTLIPTDYDFDGFVLPLEIINEYPKVGNKLTVKMRIAQGCPRKCSMCPCPLIYNGHYKFYNIQKSLETIQYYYDNGVRFFNLIDDNLSCTPKFITFLKELKKLNLKGSQFMCQEGFEVLSFHNEEFCQLIIDNNFVDIKLGIENVNEDFLEKINKYYNKFADIQKALDNIRKYNLDVKMYLLLGLDETREDVIENLKFISSSGFAVRCNIIRPYEGSELYKKGFERKLSDKELNSLKSFAHSISWLNETYKINFYAEDALKQFKERTKIGIKKDDDKIIITGKLYFGFKTSKFISVLSHLLEEHFKITLKVLKKEKDEIIFQKIKGLKK